MFSDQAPLIILDRKSDVGMAKNGKDNKHTRHIDIIIHFVINGEDYNLQKAMWCEGGLQLSYIGTNNVREEELNPKLGYYMVILEN